MGQLRLALIMATAATAVAGCGRESGSDGAAFDRNRPATRVLRADQVKISLGPEKDAKAEPAGKEASAPAATPPEGSAP